MWVPVPSPWSKTLEQKERGWAVKDKKMGLGVERTITPLEFLRVVRLQRARGHAMCLPIKTELSVKHLGTST